MSLLSEAGPKNVNVKIKCPDIHTYLSEFPETKMSSLTEVKAQVIKG